MSSPAPASASDPDVAPRRPIRAGAAILSGWFAIALILSFQAYLMGLYRGSPQPWWPSFGYTLAIFSVWALMTPPLLMLVRRIERGGLGLPARLVLYAVGLPAANALHVGLFALIYWPLFNDGGRIGSRWAMGERMLLLNFDTNALFYAALVAGTALLMARRRRRAGPAPELRPAQSAPAAVRIRARGAVRLVPLDRIEWIAAAGNYTELHTNDGTFLADESLAALERRLPPADFARIHRGAIVRLDRVRELRSLGRGDARVMLAGGVELRLSRRFRDRLPSAIRG